MSSKKRYQDTAKKYVDVLQPVNFETYNKHMGYVDAMNQQISTYCVKIQQKNGGSSFPFISLKL